MTVLIQYLFKNYKLKINNFLALLLYKKDTKDGRVTLSISAIFSIKKQNHAVVGGLEVIVRNCIFFFLNTSFPLFSLER